MPIEMQKLQTVRGWLLPLSLALISVAVALGGESADLHLRYERSAILQGEIWRLLSAHLTHLGWSHLGLNLAGLVISWLLVGRAFNGYGWGVLFVFSSLFISLCMLLWNPELQWYVGLSGVLHGFLLAGATYLLLGGDKEGALLLLLVVAKLVWEQMLGPLPGSEEAAGGAVVVDAHLYGAVAGVIFAVVVAGLAPLRRQLAMA